MNIRIVALFVAVRQGQSGAEQGEALVTVGCELKLVSLQVKLGTQKPRRRVHSKRCDATLKSYGVCASDSFLTCIYQRKRGCGTSLVT
jgi:hypothetical protein